MVAQTLSHDTLSHPIHLQVTVLTILMKHVLIATNTFDRVRRETVSDLTKDAVKDTEKPELGIREKWMLEWLMNDFFTD